MYVKLMLGYVVLGEQLSLYFIYLLFKYLFIYLYYVYLCMYVVT